MTTSSQLYGFEGEAMKEYEVREPVYGFIKFNEWEREIINHRVFQRLRRIRQLALTDMVYPGAVHTRFEHSLGVMHLATKMYNAIIGDDTNKQILKDNLDYIEAGLQRDKQVVRFAALLHDVGHAPFSHASESILKKSSKTGKPYKHEDYTTALIRGPLRDAIETHNINKNFNINANEVADLIEGNPTTLRERVFWKIIIDSQLDADRGDYLLRDSLHSGVKYGVYDLDRLIVTLALGIDPETNDVTLGIKESGWHVAESLIIARYQMFTQVYFHKTRRAYDYMLQEAIKSTIKTLPPPDEIESYLKLDDHEIWHQMKKNDEVFWCNSIMTRNHLRLVYETREIPTVEDEEIVNKIKESLDLKSIWSWEDMAKNVWYKQNKDKGGREEIAIIGKDKSARPLSEYSKLVKNLGELRQIRLYVKLKDRDEAEKIIGMVKK